MRLFRIFNLTLLLLFLVTMTSCDKPAPLPQEESIAVSYDSIAGCWELSDLQGVPLDENTHLYIYLNYEGTFEMWDNLDSMYLRKTTGCYSITTEEDGTYTISGSYDNGVGKWSNDYRVTLSNEGLGMEWQSRGDIHEIMKFVFLGDFPDDINN